MSGSAQSMTPSAHANVTTPNISFPLGLWTMLSLTLFLVTNFGNRTVCRFWVPKFGYHDGNQIYIRAWYVNMASRLLTTIWKDLKYLQIVWAKGAGSIEAIRFASGRALVTCKYHLGTYVVETIKILKSSRKLSSLLLIPNFSKSVPTVNRV